MTELPERLAPLVTKTAAAVAKLPDKRPADLTPPLEELAAGAYAMGLDDGSQVLSSEAAAEQLGIGINALRKLATARHVGRQVGRGTWLFSPADVAALRDRHVGRPRKTPSPAVE